MPVGVQINRTAAAGPVYPAPTPSATYFAAGLTERGPDVDVSRVTSLAEFEAVYGPRPTYGNLYDDIATYFAEGGSAAQIARVVGPAATEGSLASPLVDNASVPVATLQVTAQGPGAWSAGLAVDVDAGSVDNTFTLSVLYNDEVVERYANLASPQEAVSRTSGSSWVRLTDLGSTTAPPQNNPAITASPVALAAGSDDRAAVDAAALVAALDRFGAQFGDGAVAIPGGGDAVHAGLIAHASGHNRIALLATTQGLTTSQLATLAASLNTEYAGLFTPWVRIRDAFGGTRAISPEGYVAAARSRAHRQVGPWQAPAGERSRSVSIVAADEIYDQVTAGALNDAKVSPIMPVPGGVRLYGWRSLSADEANWEYLTGAEVINRIVVAAETELDPLVFSSIDAKGHLLSRVEGALQGIVAPLADRNGLFPWVELDAGGQPVQIDPGYQITTQSSREVASANKVVATLAVRVSPTAALVELTVSKVGVTRRF